MGTEPMMWLDRARSTGQCMLLMSIVLKKNKDCAKSFDSGTTQYYAFPIGIDSHVNQTKQNREKGEKDFRIREPHHDG
jgi:hypothetical protein